MASKLIINEFLTFVQNKIDILDELSIVQICATNYTDEEIETGKDELYANIADSARKLQRKGEDKKKKNIKDVIKMFKETDPTLQPTFVAKDLNRLPPVTFEHVDVTRLLKDLVIMKTDLQSLRNDAVSKTELNEFQAKIASDFASLRTSSYAIDRVHTTDKNIMNQEVKQNIVTPQKKRTQPPVIVPQRKRSDSLDSACAPCYRDIVRTGPQQPRLQANRTFMQARRPGDNSVTTDDVTTQSVELMGVHTHASDNDFKTVMRKKQKQKNMRGTSLTDCKIKVNESKSSVYLSRASKDTTVDDIKSHILDMGQEFISVEMLKQYREVDFNSFKIVVVASRISNLLEKDFWPKGLVFRRFRERINIDRSTTNYNG